MNRTRETIIEAVRGQMPTKRWKHTEGVMKTSIKLAERFGGDAERSELAAILHDVAKYWDVFRMEQIIREQNLPHILLGHDKQLWHAAVGAYVAEVDFGITDMEVLDAIRYHTSGRVGMTLMDKIVCLADYIEPGRDFPGVDKIRKLAEHSLEEALIAGFDSTIELLLAKKKRIFPLTIEARNDLIQQLGG